MWSQSESDVKKSSTSNISEFKTRAQTLISDLLQGLQGAKIVSKSGLEVSKRTIFGRIVSVRFPRVDIEHKNVS